MQNIKHISADKNILACIDNNGNAVLWGAQLDVSAFTDLKEIETDSGAVYGLKNDGTIVSTNGRLANAQNIKHIFTCGDTLAAIDDENIMHSEGMAQEDDIKDALMLAGNTDHFIMLTDTGHVKYSGAAYSGSGRVIDWTDILMLPKTP